MINLTVESVFKALDELVEEYGEDHVYQSHDCSDKGPACRYAVEKDGKAVPDCIVGHVLVRHGFPADALAYKDEEVGEYASNTIGTNLPLMAAEGLVNYEDGVKEVLWRVQSLQDSGFSWGRAVGEAKAKIS